MNISKDVQSKIDVETIKILHQDLKEKESILGRANKSGDKFILHQKKLKYYESDKNYKTYINNCIYNRTIKFSDADEILLILEDTNEEAFKDEDGWIYATKFICDVSDCEDECLENESACKKCMDEINQE
tara:strand:+ start:524 stop:913 length:390 start_codon:yes stop_codon:yes gene_type:complete